MWRMFRHQDICREREGDPNPYKVNYDEPFRQVSEGGVEYAPAPHSAADAPPASWDSAAYRPGPQDPAPPPVATGTAQAEVPAAQPAPPAPPSSAEAARAPLPRKAKMARSASAKKKKKPVKPVKPAARKPAPDQVVSSR